METNKETAAPAKHQTMIYICGGKHEL